MSILSSVQNDLTLLNGHQLLLVMDLVIRRWWSDTVLGFMWDGASKITTGGAEIFSFETELVSTEDTGAYMQYIELI
jgi:hypothetical protein